jgi:integrase
MSVRKRTWQNDDGSQGQSWVVAYTDQGGSRRLKSFDRRRDADAFHATVGVDVRQGLHIPDSQSILVAEAARLWLESAATLERSTREQYHQHADLHIVPLLGTMKLSQLTVPAARAFEDKLASDRSPAMVRKILTSLGSILADAQERGLVAQNVVRGLRVRRRRRGTDAGRHLNSKLKAGVTIPTPDEIRALIGALNTHSGSIFSKYRPFLLTAIFTGLRASELRGLPWSNVDLKRGELHVRQRADRYNKIGPPKSDAGERAVPLTPMLINVLRAWKLACPKSDLDLAFPNSRGHVENRDNIVNRGWVPAQLAAGIVNKNGKAKYHGLHALRHFYASWCINREKDGGLELPPKMVQERMGHASITMTMDVYGHLFPRKDDDGKLAAAEKALFPHAV